ncbi:heterokaryon incompatibility protein-domain-containing protein [Dactylonectria macrodidyma]|uniref:Heterokaryon incompatibility protein-domain-containing protein n=1 Tax=Dactylonectria macrodidyma TaxID=307937 RepID=A0A9P9DP57_9HYPO|nr:heterokaryon incompatibility protein-domain-containing protein [Dactylonectria macrodidyma]
MAQSEKETSTSRTVKYLPGHDIFWTPENSHFFSKISYSALNAARREIRLTRVLPDSGCGLIECELLHNVPLADVQGQYFALSYCAGDARRTDAILVNGIRCNVFANLRHALTVARQFWKTKFRDEKFLMWVDQICINQSDLSERSHQVGFMRDIYQCARQALICLSTSKTKGRGMEWLLELCENVSAREDDLIPREWAPNQAAKRDREEDDNEEEKIDIERYHCHRLVHYIWEHVVDERFTNGWLAFYDVVESPWWSRAWVFQEFMVSTGATFLYGRHSASWKDVSHILNSICSTHRYFLTNRDSFLSLNDFELYGPQDRQFCRVLDRIERTKSQAAVDTAEFIVKTKLNWGGSADLKQLLAHSRYCNASDDRDRVYSFIGLAAPGYGIIPNYSADNVTSKVLIETTKNIILFEDSLDVLAHAVAPASTRRSMLPSWVVDWTCKEVSGLRNNHFGTELNGSLSGIKRRKPDVSFRTIAHQQSRYGAVVLEVWGIFIDALAVEIIDDWASPEERALFRSFQTWKGYTVLSTSLVECSDQLWILYGSLVPLILRQVPHESCDYRLISSAMTFDPNAQRTMGMIHDMMKSVEMGRLKPKRISIL